MLKVIIADDERIQREGIAKHVNWQAYGMQVVGLAVDGVHALELIEANDVDLLITDIKMPRKSGLELAEQAKALHPHIKIMIISGYDDFEYARVAIELKAYAFLLKPIHIDKLSQEIEKVYSLIQLERKKQQTLSTLQEQIKESRPLHVEKLLQNMLFGFLRDEVKIRSRMETLSIPLPQYGYEVLLMQIDERPDLIVTDEEKQLANLEIYQQFTEFIVDNQKGLALSTKENEFAIVLYAHEMDNNDNITQVIRHIRDMLLLPYNDILTICISARKDSLFNLNEAYKECETASSQKFYLGKGKDIYYQDSLPEQPFTLNYDAAYDRMIQALEIGNISQAEHVIEHIFDEIARTTILNKPIIKALCFRTMYDLFRIVHEANEKIETVFGDEYKLWESIYHFDTLPEIREMLKKMVVSTCRHIHMKRTRKNTNIIERVIQVLETRYNEQISIDELSKHVHLTPNYISNIFKENVGESIVDYLTKIRMKHAVRLLADESVRIYEVAEQTGYNSTSYFSVVFKSMYGLSPKEYRDNSSTLVKGD